MAGDEVVQSVPRMRWGPLLLLVPLLGLALLVFLRGAVVVVSADLGRPHVLPSSLSVSLPPDRESLGRATWTLLHVLAENWAESPSREAVANATQFVSLLAQLYPCPVCGEHFRALLAEQPVNATTRDAFSSWAHAVHSAVNARLGKAPFPRDALTRTWYNDDLGLGAVERGRGAA